MVHGQHGLVVSVHLREERAAVGLRVVHQEELPVVAQHVEEVDKEFAQGGREERVPTHLVWWVHASMHNAATGLLLLLMGGRTS